MTDIEMLRIISTPQALAALNGSDYHAARAAPQRLEDTKPPMKKVRLAAQNTESNFSWFKRLPNPKGSKLMYSSFPGHE